MSFKNADFLNALMVLPNLFLVVMLTREVARETNHYVWDKHLDERDESPVPFERDLEEAAR